MKKIKIAVFVLVGLISFPAIALGGTFISSLIQGKTADEAVQILANQIDILFSRLDTVEQKTNEIKEDTDAVKSNVNEMKIVDDELAIKTKELELKDVELELKNKELEIKERELNIKLEESENNSNIKIQKETACRKANELRLAPPETKIMEYTESDHQPLTSKFAPDTTKELLDYLTAYMENYNKTGSFYYLHNPDYMPELAGKYIKILSDRYDEYLVYEKDCQ
ncbi:MAG: hypothetical protein PHN91_00230 [Patescibacteria group bacterium]|nr:hypothetical protein [Patescibacteria group bacterium]